MPFCCMNAIANHNMQTTSKAVLLCVAKKTNPLILQICVNLTAGLAVNNSTDHPWVLGVDLIMIGP